MLYYEKSCSYDIEEEKTKFSKDIKCFILLFNEKNTELINHNSFVKNYLN